MTKTTGYSSTIPTTAAGLGGTNYANVTLTGSNGAGLTYSTGTGVRNWSTAATTPFYTKQPKVKISEEDIEIDGLSLKKTLTSLNERLGILVPNPQLEGEFDELKELAARYRELELKLLDQKVMWETLKKTDQ